MSTLTEAALPAFREPGVLRRLFDGARLDPATGCILTPTTTPAKMRVRGQIRYRHHLVLEVALGRELRHNEVTRHRCGRPNCLSTAPGHLVVRGEPLRHLLEEVGFMTDMSAYPRPGPLPGMIWVHKDPKGRCKDPDCNDLEHKQLEIASLFAERERALLVHREREKIRRSRKRNDLPPTNPHYVPPVYLTPEQAARVREMLAAGRSRSEIAREFGVSRETIGYIVNGVWSPRRR